jgi:predicted TIM-barrel fold metal-dependent hydrolase
LRDKQPAPPATQGLQNYICAAMLDERGESCSSYVKHIGPNGAAVIIDIFNHFMPRPYLDRIAGIIPDHVAVTGFPRLDTLVDIEARLRLVEGFGGLRQVLSLANPPLELIGPPAVAVELARIANDSLAEICRKYPHAFPAFIAALPTNDIDASIEEMDRAISTLDARGVQLFTNVCGKPLSGQEFRPLFRRMAEHDLPIWVHPMRGPNFPDYAAEKTSEDEIWFSFGWPYETTACMTRLIYSGLFDELPHLKIITHHMGFGKSSTAASRAIRLPTSAA